MAASYDGSRNALGMFDGEGKAVLASGSVYVGDWKEGKMEGVGKLIFKDGMLYEGAFKNNCITGHGVSATLQAAVPLVTAAPPLHRPPARPDSYLS